MQDQTEHLESIKDIKQLMHKSSRFISLSGLSGISAGLCALVAAIYAGSRIECWKRGDCAYERLVLNNGLNPRATLLWIGLVTFVAAFALAFLFTWLRSRKTGVPVWGFSARRVMINVGVPMVVGGLVIWRLMDFGLYGLIPAASMLFYGLGLINASKYTYPEIRYVGYGQLLLGIANLWLVGYGLYFWAAGFGLLHILYGIIMWNKYERNHSLKAQA